MRLLLIEQAELNIKCFRRGAGAAKAAAAEAGCEQLHNALAGPPPPPAMVTLTSLAQLRQALGSVPGGKLWVCHTCSWVPIILHQLWLYQKIDDSAYASVGCGCITVILKYIGVRPIMRPAVKYILQLSYALPYGLSYVLSN